MRMRLLAPLFALAACSGAGRAPTTSRIETTPPGDQASRLAPVAPGLRLPDGVPPLHYDVTLAVDPKSEHFFGEVHFRVRLDRAIDHVWMHVHELAIKSARYDGGELTTLPIKGDQMVGFGFGKTLPPGEHELVFVYSGKTTGDQEGLFRQKR